jgi:peroxiredoxin
LNRFRHCLLVVALGCACWVQSSFAEDNAATDAAPDFVLRSVGGENVRLSEYQGQVVVIGFWARWCGDCREAMQALEGLYSKYQRAGLVMLGINVDDSLDQTRAMAKSLGMSFPVLIDAKKAVSDSYKVKTMPLIVLIDRAGQVRFRHKRYELGDQNHISDEIRQLLNE